MKKTLSMILAVLVILSVCSFSAFAEEEKKTITIALELNTNVVDYDTNWFTLEMEEKFNVNIEFMLMEKVSEKLPIVVSSGAELPDMILSALDTTLVWSWAQQGVLVPLTEYWNDPEMLQGLYDHLAFNCGDPAGVQRMLANVVMPDGEIYTIPSYDENFWNLSIFRMRVNTEWLEAAGMEIPTTLDEFMDMLIYFRDNDMNGNGDPNDEIPLTGSTGWGCNAVAFLLNAFIHANPEVNYINVEDGKVVAAYTQDAFKDALEYIHEMYEEGLIDPLAFTQDATQMKAMINGDVSMVGAVTAASDSNFTTPETQAKYTIIGPVTGPDGACFAPTKSAATTGKVYVTSHAEDPALCFLMGSVTYDLEWRQKFGSGIEGEHWTRDPEIIKQYVLSFPEADYSRVFSKQLVSLLNTPNNIIWGNEVLPFYGDNATVKNAVSTKLVSEQTGEEKLTTNQLHSKLYYDHQPSELLGTLIYTDEEIEKLGETKTNIDSYVQKMITAFIVGNESLDNWDAYLAELDNMGMETYLEVMQAAYDRKGV